MSKRILLVDDDAFIRDVNEEVLRDAGFEVVIAEDGKTALEQLTEGGYGLVFLDVIMPLLDGIGVLTKLQEVTPKEKNGSIYFLTNLANDPAVKAAAELGVKACIVKADITPDKLVEIAVKELGQPAAKATPEAN